MGAVTQRVSHHLRTSAVTAPYFRRIRSRQMSRAPLHSEYRWMYGLSRSGTAALDVGANVGQTAALLSRAVGPDGMVLALEPLPEAYLQLRLGTRASNVIALPYAAGAEATTATLHLPLDASGVAQHQLASLNDRADSVAVEVVVRRLDDFLPLLHLPVSFMKVDVEGYELEVLQGARELVGRHRPRMVIEVEDRHQPPGRQMDEVFDEVLSSDYDVYGIGLGGLVPLRDFDVIRDQLEPIQTKAMSGYVNNFVAIPRP